MIRKNKSPHQTNIEAIDLAFSQPPALTFLRNAVARVVLLALFLLMVSIIGSPVPGASAGSAAASPKASNNDGRFEPVASSQGSLAPCGAAGGLDASFGTGGIVTTGVGPNSSLDIIQALAIQADGKIVAAGSGYTNDDPTNSGRDFAVVRYNADGSLDSAFGVGGKVMTDIGTSTSDGAFVVAVQPDGKIVAAGFTFSGGAVDVAIVRYNSNGSLDSTFGSAGKIVKDFAGAHDEVESLVIQPDGKIVVLVDRSIVGSGLIGMARYNADGSLDPSFGSGGILVTDWPGANSRAASMAIQSDGKFVLAGFHATQVVDSAIARLNSDGSTDTSFGTDGFTVLDLGSTDQIRAVAVQPDGKIVTGGTSYVGPNVAFTVARFTTGGTLDTSFGSAGKQVTRVGNDDDILRSLAIQADGRIVAAGSSANPVPVGNNRDFAAVRYNVDGSLDTTFNGTGIAKTPVGSHDDYANAVADQPDGRFVAAGSSSTSGPTGNDFALVRYKGTCEIAVEGQGGQGLTDGSSTADLGSEALGVPGSPKVFTIRNAGTEPLLIGAITIDGANSTEYSVNTANTAATVAPNSSTTFSVTFTPTGVGTRSAVLHIESSDQNENPFDIDLVGQGISGVIYNVTVTTANGTVTSSPAGLVCPGTCTSGFDEAAQITLTATPNLGNRFVGWTGDAAGTANPLTVTMNGSKNITAVFEPPPPAGALFDFDGDRLADLSVRRPSDRIWYLLRTTAQYTGVQLGQSNDRIAPADYDGDGKTDIAVYRPSSGTWQMYMSQSGALQTFGWGQNGDLPVPSDRDGDGRSDLVLYRPSNSTWYTRQMSNGHYSVTQFGAAGDKPLRGDFDGDGRSDLAVFRPSNNIWYIQGTIAGFYLTTWGETGDIPVPADYDADGRTDIAIYRPSLGRWYVIGSTDGWMIRNWGEAGDTPVPADYDGDGRADVAIFRPSNGTWYIIRSASGDSIRQFGQNGDVPIPSAFVY